MTGNIETDLFYARSAQEWRDWLAKNGPTQKAVRLILYHRDSGIPCVSYGEAVEHALCYGWVDNLAGKRDADSSTLRFTPRKPTSNWSLVNRERAERMIARGLMTPAGQALIDLAKSNGRWDALEGAQTDVIPADLQTLFDQNPAAERHFLAFAHSFRRAYLEWIANAKQPETRLKRLARVIELAEKNQRTLYE